MGGAVRLRNRGRYRNRNRSARWGWDSARGRGDGVERLGAKPTRGYPALRWRAARVGLAARRPARFSCQFEIEAGLRAQSDSDPIALPVKRSMTILNMKSFRAIAQYR